MNISGNSFIITGAGSGIGKSLAILLGDKQARITLVGRREAPLQEVADKISAKGGQAFVYPADVTTPDAAKNILEAAIEHFGKVDVLINNAGNVRAGRLENMSESEVFSQINLNLTAPILLTQTAIPYLRQNTSSLIVNVSSAIALVGMPFYSVYAATKAGIAHFSEALRRELYGEGIDVLTVYPGATSTPMMESSNATAEHGFDYESADNVAKAIVEAIENNSVIVVRGGETRKKMIEMNQQDPISVDKMLAGRKDSLEAAVSNHSSI